MLIIWTVCPDDRFIALSYNICTVTLQLYTLSCALHSAFGTLNLQIPCARLSTVGSCTFLSLAPQHGMTFCFLPDRNPFWTPFSQTSRHFLAELLKVYKPTCQLHSSSDRLIQFPFFVFHSAHTLAWSEIFLMLLHVSGTVPCKVGSSNTLESFKSSLKSHLFMLFYWLYV